MKIVDKNIDIENAKYWSVLNDRELKKILDEICKKAKSKKPENQLQEEQLLNEFEPLTLTILGAIATLAMIGSFAFSMYATAKDQGRAKRQEDRDIEDKKLGRRDSAIESGDMVLKPDIFVIDKEQRKKIIQNIIKPTGAQISVTYQDLETGKTAVGVADEYAKVGTKEKFVIELVGHILKGKNGEVTADLLEQTLEDLKNKKKVLHCRIGQSSESWDDIARTATIDSIDDWKKQTGSDNIDDLPTLVWDDSSQCLTANGVKISSPLDKPPKDILQGIGTDAENQNADGKKELKDTSSSLWPWILGAAAIAVAVPFLWNRLGKVTDKVKMEKMLAKCEFTCTDSNLSYCFGFNLKDMQWTLSYQSAKSSKKPGNEETSSFADTSFAKKFADAVEIQMKNFYSEKSNKPVYKAVEVAGKEKAKLIKLLFDNKEQIENSLYNMSSCKSA